MMGLKPKGKTEGKIGSYLQISCHWLAPSDDMRVLASVDSTSLLLGPVVVWNYLLQMEKLVCDIVGAILPLRLP